MVVDAGHLIQFASPAVATTLGCPADSIVGRPLLGLVHPDDAVKGAQFLAQLVAIPATPQAVHWRLRHSAGTFRQFETVGSYVADESAVVGLVINSRDLSDRVVIERQLREAQKLQALGQLVGGIAHTFNNILTSTMMRLVELRRNSRLPGEMVDEIVALEKEARRSADLTKKLVSFGQQQFLRKRRVNLRTFVSGLRLEMAKAVGSGVQISILSGTSQEWVEADAALLEQVILSIAGNARDAMAQEGTLTLEVTGIESVYLNPPPDGGVPSKEYVCLGISDTGCGMTEGVRQRLFEPFFTTKEVGKGLGMGLAAVHGIVRQHRGWIGVESAVGHGSTFRVYLPKSFEAAPKSGTLGEESRFPFQA
jgi:two-component system cell cycle sensor histidine kinase/response regulator CckA